MNLKGLVLEETTTQSSEPCGISLLFYQLLEDEEFGGWDNPLDTVHIARLFNLIFRAVA